MVSDKTSSGVHLSPPNTFSMKSYDKHPGLLLLAGAHGAHDNVCSEKPMPGLCQGLQAKQCSGSLWARPLLWCGRWARLKLGCPSRAHTWSADLLSLCPGPPAPRCTPAGLALLCPSSDEGRGLILICHVFLMGRVTARSRGSPCSARVPFTARVGFLLPSSDPTPRPDPRLRVQGLLTSGANNRCGLNCISLKFVCRRPEPPDLGVGPHCRCD